MKILVLSHSRCGSTTLCKWLSKELNLELDETPYNYKTFNSVFKLKNIIRKIIVENYYPTNEDISKFDKVICLKRESSNETAISYIQCKQIGKFHEQYETTKEWIHENENEILEQIHKYDQMKLRIKEYEVFQTTYEGIYINKHDINKILNYIDINSPSYLDMLDYNKKYRKDNNIFIKKNMRII